MRLLMTTDTVGGVWTFTSELANELLKRGHEVSLVSFGGQPSAEQKERVINLTNHFTGIRFTPADVPLEWMTDNARAYSGGEDLLLELCRTFQPHALITSQFCFGALPVDAPKIVIAHSDVLSWADAVGEAPLAEDAWLANYRRLVQRGLNGADVVVAPTATMLNDLQKHLKVRARTQVIANGRSLSAPVDLPSRKLQAVTAGRIWDKAKNLKMLEECESPMPIMVAGDGAGIEVTTSVRVLGRQSEAALHKLFRESAIYICSSVYEPFGLAPLEAALCGCAVLANDIPSLREVWGDAALYFHDAASLSDLLSTLRASPESLGAAQARSHERALTFTSCRMAENYLQLVASMVQEKRRSEAHAA